MQPETRYAKSGDVHIAYQVVGDGPIDLVMVIGAFSHLEWGWEDPSYARFLSRLSSFCRLIQFDKRGTGLSDRGATLPTLEERMDDVRAVMDAVGSTRAALLGISEGGPMSLLFAATYPERTTALILYGSFAKFGWAPDYPMGYTAEDFARFDEIIGSQWGQAVSLPLLAPSLADDAAFRAWWQRYERMGASPGAIATLLRNDMEIDVRHVLSTISAPTLVLHRTGDMFTPVTGARYIAERIPGAKFIELPGNDHVIWAGDAEAIVRNVQEFVTGTAGTVDADRVLATVLFTDIVGSTQRAAEMGDHRWRALLDAHHVVVRRELARFRGKEIGTAGDGFLASFDGPARAIRCATSIRDAVRTLGIQIRAGLHTGECERNGNELQGIAVHIGARVAALAGPSEVLVSSTVKDLVAGSGLSFTERGVHELKGVPGEWRLFAVDSVRN